MEQVPITRHALRMTIAGLAMFALTALSIWSAVGAQAQDPGSSTCTCSASASETCQGIALSHSISCPPTAYCCCNVQRGNNDCILAIQAFCCQF